MATVLRAATSAAADGDGSEACAHLTPRGLRQVETLLQGRPEVRARECPAAVEEVTAQLPATAVDALRAPVISEVRVDGERATVNVEPPADLKELALAAGFTDVVAEVQLVKLDGRWKIDGGRL